MQLGTGGWGLEDKEATVLIPAPLSHPSLGGGRSYLLETLDPSRKIKVRVGSTEFPQQACDLSFPGLPGCSPPGLRPLLPQAPWLQPTRTAPTMGLLLSSKDL